MHIELLHDVDSVRLGILVKLVEVDLQSRIHGADEDLAGVDTSSGVQDESGEERKGGKWSLIPRGYVPTRSIHSQIHFLRFIQIT